MSTANPAKKFNRRRFLVQSAASIATLPLINPESMASTYLNKGEPGWLRGNSKHSLNKCGWAEGGTKSMMASFPPRRDPFASGLGNTCTLQEQTFIGPCYFNNLPTDDDISDGEPGVPMGMVLKLTDLNCRPITGANIEIWWANSIGIYSGDSSNATNGVATKEEAVADFGPNGPTIDPDNPPSFDFANQPVSKFYPTECSLGTEEETEKAAQSKFFRGVKITNKHGNVYFKGCFPGWYTGRAPHIHIRVTLANNESKQWVYQLGFDDDIAKDIYLNHPDYTGFEQDTTNDVDGFFVLMGGIENHQMEIQRQFDGSMLVYKALQIAI